MDQANGLYIYRLGQNENNMTASQSLWEKSKKKKRKGGWIVGLMCVIALIAFLFYKNNTDFFGNAKKASAPDALFSLSDSQVTEASDTSWNYSASTDSIRPPAEGKVEESSAVNLQTNVHPAAHFAKDEVEIPLGNGENQKIKKHDIEANRHPVAASATRHPLPSSSTMPMQKPLAAKSEHQITNHESGHISKTTSPSHGGPVVAKTSAISDPATNHQEKTAAKTTIVSSDDTINIVLTDIRCKMLSRPDLDVIMVLSLNCSPASAQDEIMLKREDCKILVKKIVGRKVLDEIVIPTLREEMIREMNGLLRDGRIADIEFLDFRIEKASL